MGLQVHPAGTYQSSRSDIRLEGIDYRIHSNRFILLRALVPTYLCLFTQLVKVPVTCQSNLLCKCTRQVPVSSFHPIGNKSQLLLRELTFRFYFKDASYIRCGQPAVTYLSSKCQKNYSAEIDYSDMCCTKKDFLELVTDRCAK